MNRRLVTVGFYILFFVFLVSYLQDLDYSVLRGVSPSWRIATVATMVALASRYWGVFVWLSILQQLGANVQSDRRELAAVYAKSWLGRYLPGKVAWIAGKVYFASQKGIPKRKLAVSSLLEAGAQTVVALILSLVLLSLTPELSRVAPGLRIATGIAAVVVATALIPPVFNRITSWVHLRMRGSMLGPDDYASTGILRRTLVLYCAGYLLSGLSYYLLTRSLVVHIGADETLFLIAVFNLAGAIGVLAIFAPSGLGIREGAQMLLLPLVMPVELALAVTVVARLWSVCIDLLFFCMAAVMVRVIPDRGTGASSQI